MDKGPDYLLAVKANQPTLRAAIESAFSAATWIDTCVDFDKGHGRIEQRSVSVITEVDWLNGERAFRASCACGEDRLHGRDVAELGAPRGARLGHPPWRDDG